MQATRSTNPHLMPTKFLSAVFKEQQCLSYVREEGETEEQEDVEIGGRGSRQQRNFRISEPLRH